MLFLSKKRWEKFCSTEKSLTFALAFGTERKSPLKSKTILDNIPYRQSSTTCLCKLIYKVNE